MKIAICGDSFGVPDPEYGPMWADHLAAKLAPGQELINLSQTGASNMLISLQVDHALEQAADCVLVHFTSCTRETLRVRASNLPLYEQFQNSALIPYAIPTCTTLEPYLPADRIDAVRRHYVEYSDLQCAIYINQCIIQSVLYKLQASGVAWAWDQGGFEHPSFAVAEDYFSEFDHCRTGTCLWDYADSRSYRPYYHITDDFVHQMIADRYFNWATNKL